MVTRTHQIQQCDNDHQQTCVCLVPQLEEELLQLDKTNTQLKLSISDLKLQRRSRDKETRTERQRVSSLS